MRVLLDECVDSRLAEHISGHVVTTVAAHGWGGISNGKLLALAQAEFDVFVAVDRNLSFQQNLPSFKIAVFLIALIPAVLSAIPKAAVGSVTSVGR